MTAAPPSPTGLALLRVPFPDHQISKLPKPTKQQTADVANDYKKGIRCQVCGGWHHPNVVHLDYVGHAALTDRLLDADPSWSWEPASLDADGLPAFDKGGGLWIKLTVCGVTRLGYGNAASKPGGDPGNREKEVIGDALRNAGMRFGAALDLWHKGDLHVDDDDGNAASAPKAEPKHEAKPAPRTLAERAMLFEGALRKAPHADLAKAWAKGSALCAELDEKLPERLVELTELYNNLADPVPFN